MSIKSMMPSNCLILCHPLLLLPSVFPSIRVSSNELALHIRWLKYWSFSFNISPSNEYSGLISFRIDWFELLSVQGTLKRLLQHHTSKASILHRSAFFMVQLSHPYMLFSCSVMSYSLWPHGLQHARFPHCSPPAWVCSNSCPLSWWCHPTISSSVVPFSSCLHSCPESGSFLLSLFFTSGGQRIGASASVHPMNIEGWFLLGLTGLISLQSKGLSRVFNTTVQKHQFFSAQLSL